MIAIVYLFSMLHFGLPSARSIHSTRDTTFRGCQRGAQYALTTFSRIDELLTQPHSTLREADGLAPVESLAMVGGGEEGRPVTSPAADEKFFYFQGLYVPAVPPPEER